MEPTPPAAHFLANRSRIRIFGLTLDDGIRVFFGGNAVVSVIVLTLITYFLFREGAGFFGQNRQNLLVYRQAGLEYVDFMRRQQDDHTALTRYLSRTCGCGSSGTTRRGRAGRWRRPTRRSPGLTTLQVGSGTRWSRCGRWCRT